MVIFGLLLGVFGYLIYLLGLLHLLYPLLIQAVTIIYWGSVFFFFRKPIINALRLLPKHVSPSDIWSKVLVGLFLLLAFVNLIGALAPELAFDALWYHLALPKIYLLDHSVHVISGELLYYSGMPQLGEMYYLVALAFQGEILAKLIHFFFGILSCVILYLFSKKFLPNWLSLLVVIIFYSNLVVAWESTTAYVDLIRTFFEITAIYTLFLWRQTKESKYIRYSGLLLGMEVGTKLLALGSVPLFLLIILLTVADGFRSKIKTCMMFVSWMIIPVLPWTLSAFIQTGNPIYPLFTSLHISSPQVSSLSPMSFIKSIFTVFTQAADPVSPVYLICLPLIIFIWKKISSNEKLLVIFSLLALFVWYITPDMGGGRFILPYLPVLSIVVGIVIQRFLIIERKVAYLMVGISLLLFFITLGYRSAANARYLPVVLGKESKDDFLKSHLKFTFGDFYDTDGYFKNQIKPTDRVLLYGFHNLYYVNFPFVDSSWRTKEDRFTYVATQAGPLPKEFSHWRPIYYNKVTDVTLFTPH